MASPSERLLPCPFCGGEPSILSGYCGVSDWWMVECPLCDRGTEWVLSEVGAVSDWNTELGAETYACLHCGRELVATDGVFVHDDVPHPEAATFDEEGRPQ